MKTLLVYLLAVGAGIVVRYVYGVLYGVAASILLPVSFLRRLPAGFVKHHNKIYLHLLWISGQLVATVTACLVLIRFEVPVGWPFLLVLCLGPALVFNSRAVRRPENLGYFNFPGATMAERSVTITNRLEGVSRMVGLLAGVLLVR